MTTFDGKADLSKAILEEVFFCCHMLIALLLHFYCTFIAVLLHSFWGIPWYDDKNDMCALWRAKTYMQGQGPFIMG